MILCGRVAPILHEKGPLEGGVYRPEARRRKQTLGKAAKLGAGGVPPPAEKGLHTVPCDISFTRCAFGALGACPFSRILRRGIQVLLRQIALTSRGPCSRHYGPFACLPKLHFPDTGVHYICDKGVGNLQLYFGALVRFCHVPKFNVLAPLNFVRTSVALITPFGAITKVDSTVTVGREGGGASNSPGKVASYSAAHAPRGRPR